MEGHGEGRSGCDQVFERVLSCGMAGGAGPLVAASLSRMTSLFEAHQHAACLRVLGVAVIEFPNSGAPSEAPLISSAFCRACAAAAPLLLARHCQFIDCHCVKCSCRLPFIFYKQIEFLNEF